MENKIVYEAEELMIKKINYLANLPKYMFKLLVNNEDDVTSIPEFNFEYEICDCKENDRLLTGKEWFRLFNLDKPVVFINTNYMFKMFEEVWKYDVTGDAAWAQYFYQFYRDKMWKENKTKFLFMVTLENVDNMWNYVNAGFTCELYPFYYEKSNQKILKKEKAN